ncbi:MAG: hypothetical protein HQM06_07125 [Magnetococcales bacterium]|nr:hypothetical protein [Magnetococcales bacterium]
MQNLKRMSGVIAMLVAMGLWAATPVQAADMGGSMQTMEKQQNAGKKHGKKAKKAKKGKKKAAATM